MLCSLFLPDCYFLSVDFCFFIEEKTGVGQLVSVDRLIIARCDVIPSVKEQETATSKNTDTKNLVIWILNVGGKRRIKPLKMSKRFDAGNQTSPCLLFISEDIFVGYRGPSGIN